MDQDIERELEAIKLRNQRVEMDKAWEKSWARRIIIALITYIIALVWLFLINESGYWLKAFVPAVGYILSTLTMPIVKSKWIKKYGPTSGE